MAYWDFCRDFGGGNLTSNTVHSLDVVQWALKLDGSGPQRITPPGVGGLQDLTYHYPGDVQVQVIGRRLDPQRHELPPGWEPHYPLQIFGGLYVGDRGWLHVGRGGFLRVYPADVLQGLSGREEVLRSTQLHRDDWLAAIRTAPPAALRHRRRRAVDDRARTSAASPIGPAASCMGIRPRGVCRRRRSEPAAAGRCAKPWTL